MLCVIALAVPASADALSLPIVDPTAPAARDTEPVVLTGSALGDWSAPANQTVKLPLTDLEDCQTFDEQCSSSEYAQPEVDSGDALGTGTPVDRLLGYRWDPAAKRFVQIPFQVDEQFTRYLSNSASGFSVYSGQDQHTTYAYDREGFRWRDNEPDDPCAARPDARVAKDPVAGLDDNDELAFMASDAGPQAPADATLPAGIEAARAVRVVDPTAPSATPGVVYVARAKPGGPKPAYDASNGYVSYERDATANRFELSQSNYDGYGNARTGPYCDADGNLVRNADGTPKIGRRRPNDRATVTTPRYKFRYDGRWLMTAINVSPDGGKSYGPDLVDRWKARAFAQDPGSNTPCCGYEEEETNWGGSSTLLGEKVGPVRAIRETWGADSGTNVIRRETFYRDEVRQKTWLRVHVIPPLDGIYAQWDFNAGRVTRFYDPKLPAGVPIDGVNDEVYGNFDDPCNPQYDQSSTGDVTQTYRELYKGVGLCQAPYNLSFDLPDATVSNLNATLDWSQVSGPAGTIVDRYQIDKVTDLTPGGAAQSLAAMPYYRDDACFDDGTGSDPGPKLKPREDVGEERTLPDGTARECWSPGKAAVPNGDPRYFQGSIGTHGMHLLFFADTDNARQTVPVSEIVAEQRMVMLPGDPGNVGEKYGRGFEKPLVPVVAGTVTAQGADPEPAPADPGPGDPGPGGPGPVVEPAPAAPGPAGSTGGAAAADPARGAPASAPSAPSAGASRPSRPATPRTRRLSLSTARSVRATSKGFVVTCSLPCVVVVRAGRKTVASGKGGRAVRVRFTRAGLASIRRRVTGTITARAGAQRATRAVTLKR